MLRVKGRQHQQPHETFTNTTSNKSALMLMDFAKLKMQPSLVIVTKLSLKVSSYSKLCS